MMHANWLVYVAISDFSIVLSIYIYIFSTWYIWIFILKKSRVMQSNPIEPEIKKDIGLRIFDQPS
jgi:hypothetical protein